MSLNLLVCPQCKCPLSVAAGTQALINCPRCNSWVEVDPLCRGSCLSCHKMHQIEPQSCTQSLDEKSGSIVVHR